MNDTMQKLVSLCKRRGFIYPSSSIYGGMANAWDFGPLGVELIENIKKEWWDRFVRRRSDMVGISTGIIMNPKVWQASGHSSGFSDIMTECKNCHMRFRVEHLFLKEEWEKMKGDAERIKGELPKCQNCGAKEFTSPRNFNLMFKTFLGPVENESAACYLRPETAQGMFVNFSHVLSSSRKKLPFGIAQIGKAFRNEITPRNFIFRLREFEQMEIEYFIPQPAKQAEWEKYFNYWQKEMKEWITFLGIREEKIKETEIPQDELAHYSKKTIDFEYSYPFGTKELYGLAYRTDFDLKNHEKMSGENLKYRDPYTGKEYWPHVIEPTFGVERTLLAVLLEAYREEELSDGETRILLKIPPRLSPVKVAILPLLRNRPELCEKAQEILERLLPFFSCEYDETGSIGKRYRRQDETGTPVCITIDFDTLKDNTVTLRDRDSMKQVRIEMNILEKTIESFLSGEENLSKKNKCKKQYWKAA